MRLLGPILAGATALQQGYNVARTITLTAKRGALRIVTDALGATDTAIAIRRGGATVAEWWADGRLILPGGSFGNPALRFLSSSGAGLYSSGTNLAVLAKNALQVYNGNTETFRAQDGSDADGSQETDVMIGRYDGATPAVRTLSRVVWTRGDSIKSDDKVLVFES